MKSANPAGPANAIPVASAPGSVSPADALASLMAKCGSIRPGLNGAYSLLRNCPELDISEQMHYALALLDDVVCEVDELYDAIDLAAVNASHLPAAGGAA